MAFYMNECFVEAVFATEQSELVFKHYGWLLKRLHSSIQQFSKPCSNMFSTAAQIISGDADLPVREDLGDRRRKLEIQKTNKELANMDDADDNVDDSIPNEPEEDEFYKQARLLKEAKEAAKQAKYSR